MQELTLNAAGPWVALVQSTLNKAFNGPKLAVDGQFGPKTQAALKNAQQQLGLPVTGKMAHADWLALMPKILGFETYTAQPGDTLTALAGRAGTPPPALLAANPQLTDGPLQPGARVIVPTSYPVVSNDLPYAYPIMQLHLLGLRTRYPFLKITSIGQSRLGRQLYRVQLGHGKHRVTYNASHHANEWITTPVLMRFIETVCQALVMDEPVSGHRIKGLLGKYCYDIIPMVNPDGVDLVCGMIPPQDAFYQFAAQRCQETDTPFPQGWKANAAGVDLNLNYDANWELAKQIKYQQGYTQPGPRDFVGQAPLDQPETRAMADYTNGQDFALTLAYHTQGEVIYWQFDGYQPPMAQLIGRLLSTLSGYTLAVTPPESDNAGYKDWFIQQFNRPGYTIEAGLGQNPLPISQLDKIFEDNLGMLLVAGMV